MGKKDLWQSDYFDKNERFADIFNGVLFHGETVIQPEELQEADGEIVSVSNEMNGTKVIRDKVKRWRGGYLSILSLENQSYVDYGMVFRVLKEEALGYEKQCKDRKYEYQCLNEKLVKDEYLSGIKKGDKFVPIITLVVYMGSDKNWDGAESLYEMLEMEDRLRAFVSDYKINVFDYHKYSDFSFFGDENRLLFEFLSSVGDDGKMKETIDRNRELCSKMDEDSISAILGIAGIKTNLEDIRNKEEGKETYNMCKAFEDYKEKGRQEGILLGKREGKEEKTKTIVENMLRRNMPDEDIRAIAECSQDFIDELRKRIEM